MSTKFRKAAEGDVGLILSFIKELAEYEHLEDQVVATEELLREWIFHKNKAEVIFAQEDGKEVGFALFSIIFPPFLAGRAYTLRICSCCRSTGAKATARLC